MLSIYYLAITSPIDCDQVHWFRAFPTQIPSQKFRMSPASIAASSTLKADITAMQNGDRTQGDTQGNLARSRKNQMKGMWI